MHRHVSQAGDLGRRRSDGTRSLLRDLRRRDRRRRAENLGRHATIGAAIVEHCEVRRACAERGHADAASRRRRAERCEIPKNVAPDAQRRKAEFQHGRRIAGQHALDEVLAKRADQRARADRRSRQRHMDGRIRLLGQQDTRRPAVRQANAGQIRRRPRGVEHDPRRPRHVERREHPQPSVRSAVETDSLQKIDFGEVAGKDIEGILAAKPRQRGKRLIPRDHQQRRVRVGLPEGREKRQGMFEMRVARDEDRQRSIRRHGRPAAQRATRVSRRRATSAWNAA